MPTRITTWNVQGRERPDLASVASVLTDLAPDVVLLQEVQRTQARRIARTLGWDGVVWRFKHWPLVIPPEGLAVLCPEPVAGAEVEVLARRWAFWSSHRRIALAVEVAAERRPLRVVNTHLGAGVGDAERCRQAALVATLAHGRPSRRSVTRSGAPGPAPPSIIGGDLNTAPGSPVFDHLGQHGHRDAWSSLRGDDPGHTNWKPGPRDQAPVQRLDYLLVGPALEVTDITVSGHGEPGFDRYGILSDHLPVTATITHRG